MEQIYTLGSLFDGIGGFPYAASFYGIQPLWASEIMPECIAVTKRHFPEMAHMGDMKISETGGLIQWLTMNETLSCMRRCRKFPHCYYLRQEDSDPDPRLNCL